MDKKHPHDQLPDLQDAVGLMAAPLARGCLCVQGDISFQTNINHVSVQQDNVRLAVSIQADSGFGAGDVFRRADMRFQQLR